MTSQKQVLSSCIREPLTEAKVLNGGCGAGMEKKVKRIFEAPFQIHDGIHLQWELLEEISNMQG